MLKCCKDQCPYILHDDQTIQDIKKVCKNKNPIPLDFVTNCMKQQAGIDIMNRVRLVKHIFLSNEPMIAANMYDVVCL